MGWWALAFPPSLMLLIKSSRECSHRTSEPNDPFQLNGNRRTPSNIGNTSERVMPLLCL